MQISCIYLLRRKTGIGDFYLDYKHGPTHSTSINFRQNLFIFSLVIPVSTAWRVMHFQKAFIYLEKLRGIRFLFFGGYADILEEDNLKGCWLHLKESLIRDTFITRTVDVTFYYAHDAVTSGVSATFLLVRCMSNIKFIFCIGLASKN